MKFVSSLLILLCFAVSSFSQVKNTRKYNAFSGTIVFTVEGGTSIAATDYIGSHPDLLGKIMLEVFFPTNTLSSFGLRFFGNGGYISEEQLGRTPSFFRTNIATAGTGVVYTLNVKDFFFPYLFAGIGYLWFNPQDEGGNLLPGNEEGLYKKDELNYLGEFGMRFLVTNNLSLNLSSGIQLSPNDYWDDSKEGTTNDAMFIFMGGISFAFLTETDSDGDGVIDTRDLCPDTRKGIAVDPSGCPLDADKDGVPDYKDQCPRTPARVSVDENGCPVDSDNDGVVDYLDLCPGTPEGINVDKSGCPFDEDQDGVADYEDQCPETPFDVEVNSDGCPKDDDLDGVPDYMDNCPQTPAGQEVDQEGCPVKETRIEPPKEVILGAGASFASGSTTILPGAYNELNKLFTLMKEEPISRWRIEGYTDNVGSDETNRKISLKRAEAVLQYFTSRGISPVRFEIFGYGESSPVASNDTEEGRAKNRRVRIVRVY